MARPRKPPHLKLVAGTNRPDRAPTEAMQLPVLDIAPAPPEWLPNGHAVSEWQRLAPILTANKLLTLAGLSALGQLCALHGKVVQLYAAGESPHASMVSQLRGLMNDFGLTPVAQGRVNPSGDAEKPDNRFAAMRLPK